MCKVGFLARQPWRLRFFERVGAPRDDASHAATKLRPDEFECRFPALILGSVMKKSRDRFILVASVLEHEARDRKEVRNVGNLRSLSELFLVKASREAKGLVKPESRSFRQPLAMSS